MNMGQAYESDDDTQDMVIFAIMQGGGKVVVFWSAISAMLSG